MQAHCDTVICFLQFALNMYKTFFFILWFLEEQLFLLFCGYFTPPFQAITYMDYTTTVL